MNETASNSAPEPPLTKKGLFALATIILIAGWVFWPAKPHFLEADLDRIKQDIRAEFSKRDGLKVIEVQLIRENDRKLVGFVKLEIEALAELKRLGSLFDGTIMKECMATMDDKWETLWSCR